MLPPEWLRAFTAIGDLEDGERWQPLGAGLFFGHADTIWLVTAEHVLSAADPDRLTVLLDRSDEDGVVVVPVGELQRDHGIEWLRDPDHDVAAAPMPVFPEYQLKAITEEICLKLDDLIPSMPCYTVGCPHGVRGVDPRSAVPLVLDGVIAGKDMDRRLIYTSAPTFPGNSGGPLVAIRSPFSAGGALSVGRPTVLLAGIVLETALVPDPSPPPDGPRTPALHLGIARPVDAILDLLASEKARDLLERLPSPSEGREPS